MKKQKGFTLIELLAIIVILAIIAVITVPIILNIIENSRKGAATDSAYGYKDSVNKAYVTKLSENKDIKLNDTYTVSSTGLTGGDFGDSEVTSLPVTVSGTAPTSGSLTYENNKLIGGCLVIGDYAVTFNNNGTTTIKKGICVAPLSIGDTVNYSTSLNGVTLDDWSVFYVDGDYTYIILSDYLPNAAVDTSILTGVGTYGMYTTYAQNNRIDLLNAMTTKSNWDDLLTGSINEQVVNETRSENVWAMGSPTLDLWVDSWNAMYPSDTLYTATTTSAMSDGVVGYYIGEAENPINCGAVYLSSKTGYNNTLYFLNEKDDDNNGNHVQGYWLAAPSGIDNTRIEAVRYYIDVMTEPAIIYARSFRPVIKLPTSVVNQ